MKKKREPHKAEEADRVLAALANPIRRQILDDLDTQAGMSVRYLQEELGITRQGIRKHLGELMKAGIVRRWGVRRAAIYHMDPRPIRRVFAELGRRYKRDLRPLGGR